MRRKRRFDDMHEVGTTATVDDVDEDMGDDLGDTGAPTTAPVSDGSIFPRRRRGIVALVLGTIAVGVLLFFAVLLPGYRKPTNGTYGTRLGYPALLRTLGRPLPVETATAQERRIVRSFLGEGTMASEPVLVPMVPTNRITGVYVKPGQRVKKGDLLAELDSRQGQLAADAARLAFESAKAELRRVQIGSAYTLNREQPSQDAIDVKSLQAELGLLRDETEMKQKLFDQGLLSKDRLLEAQRLLAETEHSLDAANLSLGMSSPGRGESERIAANAMQQAVLRWQDTLAQLNDYKILSPADGIVDRILVHVGEYNQVPGTPAFVVAAGLWFEGYFDQAAVNDVAVDAPAEVHLAARPDVTFMGRVTNVNAIVSYSTGGPETGRPVRPIGTGGPEWPATFQVRIELAPDALSSLVPGLTGFTRVTVERNGLAVPEAAMVSMSAGNGLLFVVNGAQWEVRRARYGAAFDGWLELLDGGNPGDKVIVEGQQVLEAGDHIAESAWQGAMANAGR
jgi:multidrug efflux pump subunit AcrA (membrane-fusion protein)